MIKRIIQRSNFVICYFVCCFVKISVLIETGLVKISVPIETGFIKISVPIETGLVKISVPIETGFAKYRFRYVGDIRGMLLSLKLNNISHISPIIEVNANETNNRDHVSEFSTQ